MTFLGALLKVTFQRCSDLLFVCSNPSVQEKILKYVTLPKLLQLLSCSQTELVQRRTIFLLSALLRGQSSATQWFLREGLGVLSSCIANRSLVVLTKMAVAMTDLLAAEVCDIL